MDEFTCGQTCREGAVSALRIETATVVRDFRIIKRQRPGRPALERDLAHWWLLHLGEGFVGISVGEELPNGGELADSGAEPFSGDRGGEQHDRRESYDEREAAAARGFGRSCGGEERANGESHDEAPEVGGVADAGDGRAEDQIVSDEGAEAAKHFAVDLEMRGRLFQINKGNEHAGETEDGARRAGSGGARMPINTGDAAKNAAGEVREEVGEAAEEALGGAAEIPEAPHVEAEMNQAEVDEHAGDETPPLAAERERTEVCAERDGLLRSGIEGGNSTEHHDGEHEYARGDESDGHRE